jgi:tetratricopeptide (TPR) repeat protein
MAIWRTRFEELIRSGREAEVLAKRQAMYASFGAPFQPVDPTLHELLSKILLDQKHYQEAIEEVDHALKLVGDDVDLLHRKALALVELQNLPEAEALIERIVNLRHDLRDNPEIASLEGRIHRQRWMVTGEQKDLDRAYEAYLRAYQADPSQYYPGINAAGLALRRGDTRQAEHLLRYVLDTCRTLQARDVVPYWVDFTAGEAQLGLGDVPAALVDYERGVARSPRPPPRDRSSALGGARRMIEAKGLQQSVADEIRRVLGIGI